MKVMYLSLIETLNKLGSMPGDASVRVFYLPQLGFSIFHHGDDESDLRKDSKLVCAGQPAKFFMYMDYLLMKNWTQLMMES